MIDFIVLGLPRSGTTWCSVWLDATHDPFATRLPENVSGGIVCTGAYLMPRWLREQTCPIAKLLPRDNDRSLERLGLPPLTQKHRQAFDDAPGELFDLWNESSARRLWARVKATPFDRDRYWRLRKVRMEPIVELDLSVAKELLRRGLMESA